MRQPEPLFEAIKRLIGNEFSVEYGDATRRDGRVVYRVAVSDTCDQAQALELTEFAEVELPGTGIFQVERAPGWPQWPMLYVWSHYPTEAETLAALAEREARLEFWANRVMEIADLIVAADREQEAGSYAGLRRLAGKLERARAALAAAGHDPAEAERAATAVAATRMRLARRGVAA